MVSMAIDALAICLELIIYFFFFRHFFGKAKYSKRIMFGIYTVLGIISFVLSVTAISEWTQIIGYVLIIWLLAFCYEGQFFVKLFVPFLFQATGVMVEDCYALMLRPLKLAAEPYGAVGHNVYYFTGVVLSNLTILLIVRLLANTKDYLFVKKYDIDIPLHFVALFMFPITMLFIIDQTGMLIIRTGIINLFTILPVVLLTVLSVLFFFFFDGLLQSIQNKQQLELLRSQLEQE